jgi:hypothetical protein
MLWSLAFEKLGVVVGDIYFLDPNAEVGSEGAERGVRLELRSFERDELKGGVYSATPIRVDRPFWRVDLLESVDSERGSLNRAHHHPRFRDWDPGRRQFIEELSADPVGWVAKQFADIERVVADARVETTDIGPNDLESLRAATPMIVGVVEHLLAEVKAGRAGRTPTTEDNFVRDGWL